MQLVVYLLVEWQRLSLFLYSLYNVSVLKIVILLIEIVFLFSY